MKQSVLLRLFLSAFCCVFLVSCGLKSEFRPGRLFVLDPADPHTEVQQKELMRIGNFLRPVLRDTLMVLPYTPEKLEENGIDRRYYKYMEELLPIMNDHFYRMAPSFTKMMMEGYSIFNTEDVILSQSIFYDSAKGEYVTDLTPERARAIGIPDDKYEENLQTLNFYNEDLHRAAAEGTSIKMGEAQKQQKMFVFLPFARFDPESPFYDEKAAVLITQLNDKYR